MNPIDNAVRIIYGNNRLHCSLYRNTEKNKRACLEALSLLTGLTPEQLTSPAHPESIQAVDGRIDTYQIS